MESLLTNSRTAKVFCLVHKMDLIADEHRERIFAEREAELLKLSDPADCRVFRSSIWDETLYKVVFLRTRNELLNASCRRGRK